MKFNGIECLTNLSITVDFSFTVAFITWTLNRVYFCFSIAHIKVRYIFISLHFGRLLFLVRRRQGTLVHYKQTLTKQYILMKIEIKFTGPISKQLEYVVECVSRSLFDPKQIETVICFFYLNLLDLVKLNQYTKLFSWEWFNLVFIFTNITT